MTNWPGKESYLYSVPIFDDENPSQTPIAYEDKDLKLEDLFEELTRIENTLTNIPPFEVLRLYFVQPKEACPTSMLDPYFQYLIDAEQASRDYHVLPFDGGLWDQPLQLLQIFTAVRYERAHYERIRFERIEKKMKSKSGQGQNAIPSPNEALPPRTRDL